MGGTDEFLAERRQFGLEIGVRERLSLGKVEVLPGEDDRLEIAVALLAQFLKLIQTVQERGGPAGLEDNFVVVDEQAGFGENKCIEVIILSVTENGALCQSKHLLPLILV